MTERPTSPTSNIHSPSTFWAPGWDHPLSTQRTPVGLGASSLENIGIQPLPCETSTKTDKDARVLKEDNKDIGATHSTGSLQSESGLFLFDPKKGISENDKKRPFDNLLENAQNPDVETSNDATSLNEAQYEPKADNVNAAAMPSGFEQQEWLINRITGMRINSSGRKEFRVEWMPTWVADSDLVNARKLIAKFFTILENRKTRK
ncbi:hypothetical protein MMC31_002988, partial [Peltigera leucophlebia]|nr:hypothetical protein [Peltigera leucophlebia]